MSCRNYLHSHAPSFNDSIRLVNISPIAGPSSANITITTTATSTRINTYSTNPCPCSSVDTGICEDLLTFIILLGTRYSIYMIQQPCNRTIYACSVTYVTVPTKYLQFFEKLCRHRKDCWF